MLSLSLSLPYMCTHSQICSQHNGFTESKLMVTCDSHLRRITHYHYTSCPDFGNPPTDSFLDMVKSVGATSTNKPIVVHCSAGLGRSGTFITIHTALECFGDKRRVDIKEIVGKIRKQREGMVQTQDHYRFCLEAVAEQLAPEQQLELSAAAMEAPPPQPQFTSPTMFLPDSFSPLIPPTPEASQHSSGVTEDQPSTSEATPSLDTQPSQRESPPPPSSSPPPPISEPHTPFKFPLPPSTPEITFTGPTPIPSVTNLNLEESDVELVQRKLDSIASERDKAEQRPSNKESKIVKEQPQGKEKTEKEIPPTRVSIASITQRTPVVKPEPTEKEKEGEQPHPQKREDAVKKETREGEDRKLVDPNEAKRPPPVTKEKPKETKTLPPKKEAEITKDKVVASETPKEGKTDESEDKVEVSEKEKVAAEEQDEKEEEEEEEIGFSIGDELLDFKPPPKKSLKKEKQPKPSGQPPWRKPPSSTPPSATPPSIPAKKKRPQTPKQRPRREITKSGPDEYTKVIRKLAIPSIFGGAPQSQEPSPQPLPKPSPRRFGQTVADTVKRESEPQISPTRKPPPFGQRVLPPSLQPSVELQAENKEQSAQEPVGEKQMNVMDMIRNLEGPKKSSSTATQAHRLPTSPPKATWSSAISTSPSKPTHFPIPKPSAVKPAKSELESKLKLESKPETSSVAPSDETKSSEPSTSVGNVARLLARFQGTQ